MSILISKTKLDAIKKYGVLIVPPRRNELEYCIRIDHDQPDHCLFCHAYSPAGVKRNLFRELREDGIDPKTIRIREERLNAAGNRYEQVVVQEGK